MIEQVTPYLVQAVITLSTAYGAVRVGLNGLEKRIDKVEGKVDQIIKNNSSRSAEIAVIRDRQERGSG